jgi:hypothetical protein
MAEKIWTGAVDGDLAKAGNWDGGVPQAGDWATFNADPTTPPSYGTLTCDLALVNEGASIGSTGSPGAIYNCDVVGSACFLEGGTFNGEVTLANASTINAGTFNASVTLNGSSVVYGGTFNAVVINGIIAGGTIYDRWMYDPANELYMYTVDSTYLPPADTVLAGQTEDYPVGTPTLVLPPENEVKSGTEYGVGGDGSKGTMPSGSGSRKEQ